MTDAMIPAPTPSGTRSAADHDFGALPRAAQFLVGVVCGFGLVCVGFGLLRLNLHEAPLLLALMALSALASSARMTLPLGHGGATVSLSYIVNLGSAMLVGPWASAPVAALGGWSQCTFRVKGKTRWHQTSFSMGTLAVAVAGSGLVFEAAVAALPPAIWARWVAGFFAASVYYLLNTGLVGSVLVVTSRDTLRRVWKNTFLWSAPSYGFGAAVALVAVEFAHQDRIWWVFVLGLPVYLIYRSYRASIDRMAEEQRQIKGLADVQLAMIEALALAIEAKDNTSQEQLRRMQVYCDGLAQAIGMSEPEIRGVKMAALLHDIGNLAVPEHILSKPGRLTYDEYERLKLHPRVGAEIIRSVPFPYPVAPLVLSHHEHWDGRGYPVGLKGQEIPLGARIIAVVDCFTSMLTDRPFRPPRTYAEAIATLRENGGSALDPTLVERFIEVLPTIESRMHSALQTPLAEPIHERTLSQDVPVSALADIAVAYREEQMLRDIAHTLSASLRISDTLSLISSRLVSMMPLDSCALFLIDAASELLLCSNVVGANQEAIRGVTASTIDRLGELLPAHQGTSAAAASAAVRQQSVMVCALETKTGIVGALAIYHADRNVYTTEHHRLLTRVADHAAQVIANAVVFEQTQEQSLTDVLTGLPNRRYLDRQLSQELARVHRHGGQVSVLVLDMDGFKQINDEFGHQAGDRALREVAHVLRGSLRVYDVCARFAGDEFVVVLGECDTIQAENRRQELQRAVATLWVEPVPGRRVPLSVSVGAATFPDEADSAENVIAVADHRMYRDKGERKRLSADRETPTPSYLSP
jgi:diguanylate cyclase (GGDEF)-like protein